MNYDRERTEVQKQLRRNENLTEKRIEKDRLRMRV